MARAIGPIRKIKPEIAREAHDCHLKPKAVAATFHYFARRALRKSREALD